MGEDSSHAVLLPGDGYLPCVDGHRQRRPGASLPRRLHLQLFRPRHRRRAAPARCALALDRAAQAARGRVRPHRLLHGSLRLHAVLHGDPSRIGSHPHLAGASAGRSRDRLHPHALVGILRLHQPVARGAVLLDGHHRERLHPVGVQRPGASLAVGGHVRRAHRVARMPVARLQDAAGKRVAACELGEVSRFPGSPFWW